MTSRKTPFFVYLACVLCALSAHSSSYATHQEHDVQTLKAFAALEAQTSELQKQVVSLQALLEEARESLKAVHQILLHQQLKIKAYEKDHTQLQRHTYNDLLNGINTWRSYYNGHVSRQQIHSLLKRLPDFEHTLKHTPMHPDIRMDFILQYVGLMFCEDESVVRARNDGLFNRIFAHLYTEHRMRHQTSVDETNYLFENLREQLSVYWRQQGVNKEAIEHLYCWS